MSIERKMDIIDSFRRKQENAIKSYELQKKYKYQKSKGVCNDNKTTKTL